ncbi:predicted protein [Uncinocarpus reesii 1704]|uniref:Uncharacterized protein n=1 Tax=Uncinocarpus reesii (strain UAMH 1704) TaxID=336963 RepID=C4JN16_UNCRE|nr:uncharacterized protein UREG_04224 [Uncinocarpus reesii 1704]EEP79378.1 predicted protein [Uncinocarpus reesii 1704]
MVIDGTGTGTLIELLAECARPRPEHDRILTFTTDWECEAASRAILATIGQERSNVQSPPAAQSAASTGHDEVHDAFLVDYNFRLSAEKIQWLHQLAQSQQIETAQPGQPSKLVSDDDVVTAVFWVCLRRIRSRPGLDGTPTCTLNRFINVRHRLSPPLPAHYLGNCFLMLDESCSTDGLDQPEQHTKEGFAREIASAACILRAGLNKVDDQYVRKHLAQFSHANNWANTTIHEPDVVVTSIRRLQAYQDFGPVLGKVADFEILPYMNPNGVCTIKPDRGVNKSWEVGVTLEKEAMDELRKDPMFGWLVELGSPLQIFRPAQ